MKARGASILVIHTDSRWKRFLRRSLDRGGYEVHIRDDVLGSVAAFSSYGLVFIDLGSAMAALSRLQGEMRPNLVVLLPLEGLSVREARVYRLEKVEARIIQTPATEDHLIEFVRNALGSAA